MLQYTPEEIKYFLDLAAKLKADKKAGKEIKTLVSAAPAIELVHDSKPPQNAPNSDALAKVIKNANGFTGKSISSASVAHKINCASHRAITKSWMSGARWLTARPIIWSVWKSASVNVPHD